MPRVGLYTRRPYNWGVPGDFNPEAVTPVVWIKFVRACMCGVCACIYHVRVCARVLIQPWCVRG